MAINSQVSKKNKEENNINLLSLTVIRRDGSITPFKSDKISNAIKKAFLAQTKIRNNKSKEKEQQESIHKTVENLTTKVVAALTRRIADGDMIHIEDIQDQGVKAALVRVGASQLEFIQPTDENGGVARFIESRGETVHHICFEVDDLQGKLDKLDNEGVRLIDKTPREGLSGMIGFIHPSSTAGILYELVDRNTAKR